MPLGQKISHILSRPFLVLAYEPMLIAITIYMSVCGYISPSSYVRLTESAVHLRMHLPSL